MSEESNVREQQYRRYHRTQIAELRPYIEGEDMTDISESRRPVAHRASVFSRQL